VRFLRQALPASLYEEFEDCEAAWVVVTEMLVEWELIVDSTEQVRQRPSDSDQQKQHYSGKKKQMTYKQWLCRKYFLVTNEVSRSHSVKR
jgi:hypothetical protein